MATQPQTYRGLVFFFGADHFSCVAVSVRGPAA
jgi:hypothetical protein